MLTFLELKMFLRSDRGMELLVDSGVFDRLKTDLA